MGGGDCPDGAVFGLFLDLLYEVSGSIVGFWVGFGYGIGVGCGEGEGRRESLILGDCGLTSAFFLVRHRVLQGQKFNLPV